ncbi:MAG: sugar-binding protein [Chthonomonadetes bacterium]|nr:sugar-binding protein [Chthonomonadetes bacterium]
MRWSLCLLLACMVLAGCARKTTAPTSPTQTSTPQRTFRFAIIPKQLDNPVFNYAKMGALGAAAKLSNVEIYWNAPETNDEAKQAQIFETYVRQKVDGIAVSCVNAEIMRRVIDKAVEQGIPVVTWDSDSPNSKRQAFFGMDDYEAGKIIGEELAKLINGKGKVAILSGVQGAQNLTTRIRGVQDALKDYPDIRIVTTVYCNDDATRAESLINSVMQQHPDLAGWAMVGGWPLFTKTGLNGIKPGVTKVVSVDPLEGNPWTWIEKGYVQVCIGQKVFDWGAKSVEILYSLAQGRGVPQADEKGFVNSGLDIVVLDKSKFADPSRYISLEDYKKMFEQRKQEAQGIEAKQ